MGRVPNRSVPNAGDRVGNWDRNWDARPNLYDQNRGRYDRRVTVFAISGRRRATPATQLYFSKLTAGFSTTEITEDFWDEDQQLSFAAWNSPLAAPCLPWLFYSALRDPRHV